jgi:hypothetical protein
MEIPDLVQGELGEEEVRASVTLGDDDIVCFTPTRTLVYRGEGLLSDEKVDSFPYDFERLEVSEGRRKTKFTLTYSDKQLSFGIPSSRESAVLDRLLEGALQVSDAIGDDESVAGAFRFSELTLVITQQRVLRHLGSLTWGGDFESYLFEDVTGLEFEEGNVATAVVLSVNGRPERIKTPNDQAGAVRETLEDTLFSFYGVSSLEELNEAVSLGEDEETDTGSPEDDQDLELESDISSLVDESEQTDTREAAQEHQTAEPTATQPTPNGDADITALQQQVAELTEAVEKQSRRIETQEETIQTLIEELRQGR